MKKGSKALEIVKRESSATARRDDRRSVDAVPRGHGRGARKRPFTRLSGVRADPARRPFRSTRAVGDERVGVTAVRRVTSSSGVSGGRGNGSRDTSPFGETGRPVRTPSSPRFVSSPDEWYGGCGDGRVGLPVSRSTLARDGLGRPVLKHGPRSLTRARARGHGRPSARNESERGPVPRTASLRPITAGASPSTGLSLGKGSSRSARDGTRKMVIYSCAWRSQGKPWWRPVAILTCKSFVRHANRGERLIEPSSSWFTPKFPSG